MNQEESIPHPEYREWKRRNMTLSLVKELHEGLDEMFPGIWRRYIPKGLIDLARKLKGSNEDIEYAWNRLEPIRKSFINFDGGLDIWKDDKEAWTRYFYRMLDLYIDIMRDPNEETDEVEDLIWEALDDDLDEEEDTEEVTGGEK